MIGLILGVLGSLIVLMQYLDREMVREKLQRLGTRQKLTMDELYNLYYSDSGLPKALVEMLLEEIADATMIPAAMLRPTDSFTNELKQLDPSKWGLGDTYIEFVWHAERRESRYGVKTDLSKVITIDDYIRLIGAIELRHNPAFKSSEKLFQNG